MKNISEQNRNLIIISLIFIIIIFTALLFQNKKVDNKYVKCEELTNNDSLIYTKRSCNIRDDYKKEYQLNMPFINIKSKNINNLNNTIEKEFKSTLGKTTYIENKGKKKFDRVDIFKYKTYLSSNYLSILVDNSKIYYGSSTDVDKKIYNIDLINKKTVLFSDVIKNLNINLNNNNFISILIEMYEKEYSYNYNRVDVMYLDVSVYNYIYYFDYNNSHDIIINDRGNLVYLLKVPEPYTGYRRYCYLEVVNNKLSYSFEM